MKNVIYAIFDALKNSDYPFFALTVESHRFTISFYVNEKPYTITLTQE
jgi:hypothetical protein